MAEVFAFADLTVTSTLIVDGTAVVFGVVNLTESSTISITGINSVISDSAFDNEAILTVDGEVIEGILTVPFGENNDLQINFELSGIMSPVFPPPTPPVDFAGLIDPIEAPTLAKSNTSGGNLPPGTYRYSYAAWKGSKTQSTAPSPTADITLTTEDTVTIIYPTTDGADGYLVYREDL